MTAEEKNPSSLEGQVPTAAGASVEEVPGPSHEEPKLPKIHECIIDVQNLGKSYCSMIALRDVSTKVNAGEVTCILGDNGAGKSTLIKILSGAEKSSEGVFKVDGIESPMSSPRAALALG